MASPKSVGAIGLDLMTNYAPFKKQMAALPQKAGGLAAGAFSKLGALAGAAFAGKALFKFAKEAIGLASDLAEVQNVVDVTFGSAAGQINSFAKNAVESFGLSEKAAKQYTGTFGAMIKSMGITGQKQVEMSKNVASLAGDFSSFYNIDSETAFAKIRAGISGETEGLKQLGILLNQTALEEYLRAQGITKSVSALTQAELAQYRYELLLKSSSDAQGDFARTSGGWANQVRVMKLRWDEFKSSFGSGFITLLTPVLKGLNLLISKLAIAGQYFTKFVNLLFGNKAPAASATKANATLASALGDVASSQDTVADSTKQAGKAAKNSMAAFDKLNVVGEAPDASGSDNGSAASGSTGITIADEGTFEEIDEVDTRVSALATKVSGVFESIKKSVASAFEVMKNPFEQVKNFVMQQIFPGLTQGWQTYFAGISSVFSAYVPLLGSYLSTIWTGFTNALPGLLQQAGTTFSFLLSIFTTGWNLITGIITSALGIIKGVWDEYGAGLVAGVWEMLTKIWDYINMILNLYIKPAFETVVAAVRDLWDNHLSGMYETVATFVAKVIQAATDIYNKFIYPIVTWLVQTFAPIFQAVFKAVVNVIKDVFAIISDIVKGIFKALGGLVDFIAGVFTGDWKRAWGGIKTFFSGIWDAILGVFTGFVNSFKNAWLDIKNFVQVLLDTLMGVFDEWATKFSNIWTGIKETIRTVLNAIIGGINKFVGWALAPINAVIRGINRIPGVSIPEISVSIGQIPSFAQGGIISQPTLAMVGDNKRSPEVVAPLHELKAMLGLANSSGDSEATVSVLRMILDVLRELDMNLSVYIGNEKLDEFLDVRKSRRDLRAGKLRSARA